MADPTIFRLASTPLLTANIASNALRLNTGAALRIPLEPPPLRIPFPLPTPPAPTPPTPIAPTPAPPVAAPPPAVPQAPVESPFDKLPFPSPGDRVKADDFKALSASIKMLYDLFVLTSTLFGRPYAEVRLILNSRGYQIGRVLTVFGNEITDPADTSLDARLVLQIVPAAPGHPVVMLVLSEAVDTRQFFPNLTMGMTYNQAVQKIAEQIGTAQQPGGPIQTPQLIGLSLKDALNLIPK